MVGTEHLSEKEKLISFQAARDMLSEVVTEMTACTGGVLGAAAVSSGDRLNKFDLLASGKRLTDLAESMRSILKSDAMKEARPVGRHACVARHARSLALSLK